VEHHDHISREPDGVHSDVGIVPRGSSALGAAGAFGKSALAGRAPRARRPRESQYTPRTLRLRPGVPESRFAEDAGRGPRPARVPPRAP
jgi:hypothetical protein